MSLIDVIYVVSLSSITIMQFFLVTYLITY